MTISSLFSFLVLYPFRVFLMAARLFYFLSNISYKVVTDYRKNKFPSYFETFRKIGRFREAPKSFNIWPGCFCSPQIYVSRISLIFYCIKRTSWLHLTVKKIIGSVVKILPGKKIFLQFCLTSKLLPIYVPILVDGALCLLHSYEILSLEWKVKQICIKTIWFFFSFHLSLSEVHPGQSLKGQGLFSHISGHRTWKERELSRIFCGELHRVWRKHEVDWKQAIYMHLVLDHDVMTSSCEGRKTIFNSCIFN